MSASALPLTPVRSTLSPAERRVLTASVAGAHVLALWGLMQIEGVQQLVQQQAPLVVEFLTIAPPANPPKPPPPPPPVRTPQPPRPTVAQPAPAVVTAAPTPAPAPSAFVVPEPPPQPVAAAPTPPAPAAPPAPPAPPAAPPAPPAPKAVPASALRYAVTPPIELPLASRRLGESGTVLLRVVFDTQGRAKQVTVLRSSGFSRLDEQALSAMRQARIAPYLDNGQPVEVVAQAPLVYELE